MLPSPRGKILNPLPGGGTCRFCAFETFGGGGGEGLTATDCIGGARDGTGGARVGADTSSFTDAKPP